jgi:ATP-dependent exoDNAse (exonuclease V) beta subunit
MTMQWSEVKERVFLLSGDTVVSAGAGSGKTAVLVELYLRLLAGETSLGRPLGVEEIVAITFTDKAAAEMRERVRRGIRGRIAQGEQSVEWRRLLRELPNGTIATFHSMCVSILRENPAEAGVDPAFVLLDELAAAEELEKAIDEVIEHELTSDGANLRLLLANFPLSAPGRGKGLREHLAELHHRLTGAALDEEFLLAKIAEWDNRAEVVFHERLAELGQLVKDAESFVTGGKAQFHDKIRQLAELYRKGDLSLSDPSSTERIASMLACLGGNWGKAREIKEALSTCLQGVQMAGAQRDAGPLLRALSTMAGGVAAAYGKLKSRRGALDFEDLQEKCRDLLRSDPELRARYRKRHAVLLVDEFQDTNPLQYELVTLLSAEGQRLFLVGDPKQSIYLFRGADVEVFGEARREISARGGESHYFQESFRSRRGIISFVNLLFSEVMRGGAARFQIAYEAGDHLEAQRPEDGDTPCVELLELSSESSGEEKRELEGAVVAARIRRMVTGEDDAVVFDQAPPGKGEPSFVPRRPCFGDIAILFRRFTHLKSFERELRRQGVPYYVVKGKGFYRCQEILDILNLLCYLEFANDLVALTALLRSPLCGVSDETLYLLSTHGWGIGAWHRIATASDPDESSGHILELITPGDRQRLIHLANLINRLRPLRDRLTLPELLEEAIAMTDFASILLTTFQGEQKVANLRKLVEMARSFANRGEGALRPFVNYLAGLVDAEPTEAEAVVAGEGEDVVRLMTVHQSKGLEFPIVFIPELGAGQPNNLGQVAFDPRHGLALSLAKPKGEWQQTLAHETIVSEQRQKGDAELQRLFYVAVTRARDHLVLSGEGSGAWRKWIDGFRAGPNKGMLRIIDGIELLMEMGAEPPLRQEPKGESPPSGLPIAIRRALDTQPPMASAMEFSPTALEDYALCPRKYFYKAVMGLDEAVFAELLGAHSGKRREGGSGLTPLAKGDLAHAMLEQIDFSGSESSCLATCSRVALLSGLAPDTPGVAEVTSEVMALAASPFASEVTGKKLFREYPFVLRLRGDADYYIKGAMDLVAMDKERAIVYDYKYARGADADLSGYRFQLQAYQVALSKGWPHLERNGSLIFLRDSVRVDVPCDVAAFEKELIRLMDAIRQRSNEADFALRDECDGSHCPFRTRCRPGKEIVTPS